MKGQGPIYENNSKTRGLGEKSTKGIDRGLVSWNWRGLYAKTLGFFGNLELFLLCKMSWTWSISREP
jgi:hypothetical protein